MYIESVPNRTSPPAILLRESYREQGKVNKRTLANLTDWPPDLVEGLRVLLKGGVAVESPDQVFEIVRSLPHGHVAAVLSVARQLGLPRLLGSRNCRELDLCLAMIVERIINPQSKLATARGLDPETMTSTLAQLLDLGAADEDDLYAALDWLGDRQEKIENKLAAKHLSAESLVLYDLTSTYFEGRCCPLGRMGYSRDGKSGKLQVVFGLLCTAEGCPVAVEVFAGNTSDPATFSAQVQKVRERFKIQRIVWVGDRGMITQARIDEDLSSQSGVDWITALRAPQIRTLVEAGALQLSLFDDTDLAEISSDQFPGERLIACRNPFLAQERARKRQELLEATERELDKVVQATRRERNPLTGAAEIGERVGKVINRYHMAKHFDRQITDSSFTYSRKADSIAQEAALDGIYIIRTSLPVEALDAHDTVRAYKSLSRVERAFRSIKTVDLKVRPIHHRLPQRVRAHIFLCMLAYYVEWHMRRSLAPLLFDDQYPERGETLRDSVVAPAQRSPEAKSKAATKTNQDGIPVHSFRTLLEDLKTIVCNTLQFSVPNAPATTMVTRPTPVQAQALELLNAKL